MPSPKTLIVLGGPTASGKTDFSIRLARHFGAPILSADSRQLFREMSIGTAKPSAEELAQVRHYFIDSHSIQEDYSVGNFERDALQLLHQLFQEHQYVLLVGGSGLYIKALCEGLDRFPEVPPSIRQKVEEEYQQYGLAHLQAELAAKDPDYAREADLQNPHRLIRALSVTRASGQPFSSFRKGRSERRFFQSVYLQLQWLRQQLYGRIDQRVLHMMEAGLLDEARALFPHRHRTALQTVGYQELFEHLEGHITLEEAIRLIQRNSRRYAKRQLTWFRRDGHWKLLRPDDWQLALEFILAVREQGLRLRQEAVPFPVPGADKAEHILVQAQNNTLARFYYLERGGQTLVLPREGHSSFALRLAWHQALLTSPTQSAYTIARPPAELLPKGCVIKNVAPELLPAWMKNAWQENAGTQPAESPFTVKMPD